VSEKVVYVKPSCKWKTNWANSWPCWGPQQIFQGARITHWFVMH